MSELNSFELQKKLGQSGFFSMVKMTNSAAKVLRNLVDYYNPLTKVMYPSQITIADNTGLSRRSVIRAVQELKKIGLIDTKGESGSNLTYSFKNHFFEILTSNDFKNKTCDKMSHPPVTKCHTPLCQIVTLTNNRTNNKTESFKNFSNLNPGMNYSKSNTSAELETLRPTAKQPWDCTPEQARERLKDFPPALKNSITYKKLQEIASQITIFDCLKVENSGT